MYVPRSSRFNLPLVYSNMPRTKRNFKPECFYHIYNRGNNKEQIFKQKTDKRLFVNLIYKYKKGSGIRIVTYCVMDNHFHLIVRTGKNPKRVSKFMQKLCTSYALQINRKYDRIGHIFQSRYNANLLPYKKDLERALRYVRNNPVQDGLVRQQRHYPWVKL